jgi:hypothetical protein
MKVIGLSKERYGREYVALVSHDELLRVSDKRYGDSRLKELEIGAEFDLGAGENFRDQIKDACDKMTSAMMKFAVMIAEQPNAATEVE